MSHKASSWLAEIPAAAMNGSQFRVLFHLCDAHNSKRDPETACFPSQDRLRQATGLSNGGLNNALNALEAAGFIRRYRRTEPGTKTQRTYYILGCDFDAPQEQTPNIGGGSNSSSGRSNSTFQPNKLHPSGEYPVRNEKKEPARAEFGPGCRRQGRTDRSPDTLRRSGGDGPAIAEKSAALSSGVDPLDQLAAWINSGAHVPPSAVTNRQRDALIASGRVSAERLRQLQIY